MPLNTCSNRVGGSAAACLVVLPGTMRARAPVGTRPGACALHTVRLPARSGRVRGERRPRASDSALRRGRVRVGVIHTAARAGDGQRGLAAMTAAAAVPRAGSCIKFRL